MIRAVYASTDNVSFDKLLKVSDRETAIRACEAYNRKKGMAIAFGRYLATVLEAEYLQKEVSEIKLRHDSDGRPFFDSCKEYVSISHCENMVLVCISDKNVGCDIQTPKRFHPMAHKNCFVPSDYEFIVSSDNPDEAMNLVWTRRESMIKILGPKEARQYSYADATEVCQRENIEFHEDTIAGMKVCIAGDKEEEFRIRECDEAVIRSIQTEISVKNR